LPAPLGAERINKLPGVVTRLSFGVKLSNKKAKLYFTLFKKKKLSFDDKLALNFS
jgi:hypothetical protein